MSKQTLSIEQMQHLQGLGLDTSNASMYLISYKGISAYIPSNFHLSTSDNDYVICNAFTLQDVLDALPKEISKDGCAWHASLYIDFENERIAYGNTDRYGFEIYHEIMLEKGLINAAYSMLCWCIEQGYVETNKNE